jgi:hypothetical protein
MIQTRDDASTKMCEHDSRLRGDDGLVVIQLSFIVL